MRPMRPELRAHVIISCARYALVAFTVYAAMRLDSGMFLAAAVAIALLGGSRVTYGPDVCPKCGAVITSDDDKSDDDEDKDAPGNA